MLAVRPSFLSFICQPFSVCFVERWLGGSFAFFVWLCVVGKNANVLPKA
jgi:hypothetical protein